MYPPKVRDQVVQSIIRDLSIGGRLPSGAAVRTVLAQRFGSRGGVARIYRLLAKERERRAGTALSPITAGLLEQENSNLREQLKAARQREDAHQAHWTREVGRLRERLETLESRVRQAERAGEAGEALLSQVQEADTRVGQLEVQIRTFGPAAYRGPTGK